MRRTYARPYGHAVSPTRIVSLLFAVGLLAVFYQRAKEPETWSFITGEKADAAVPPPGPDWAKIDANLAPGPNDRDEDEVAALRPSLDVIRDRAPLRPPEMAAYWTFMDWARAEPFRDLERRATREVPFVQLWEQPDRYRGELIRLRLHVKRILHFEAPQVDADPAGLRNGGEAANVYEMWGWTDDSMALPYVVVFPDLPEGLKVGSDVPGEVVFVGYFLKVMSYTPGDTAPGAQFRGAPLLVGRVRLAAPPVPNRKSMTDGPLPIALAALGVTAIVGLGIWSALRGRRRPRRRPPGDPALHDIAPNAPGDVPEFRLDLSPMPDRVILPSAPPRPDDPFPR